MKTYKHLNYFFDRVIQEESINPSHISLYLALLQLWGHNNFINPISIHRNEVMLLSKIASITTYHKCIKHLHTLGYIKYQPSFNPFKATQIIIQQLY